MSTINRFLNEQSRQPGGGPCFAKALPVLCVVLVCGCSQLPSQRTASATHALTYTNPVYAGSMPDPSVMRYHGVYYAYGTTGAERTPDGRIFTLLRSRDLVHWEKLGGALLPPSDNPRVLRSLPGHVRGPGHHSIVPSPDDRSQYLVYHAWDPNMQRRWMCIDKLERTSDGPRCQGPTFTSQPAP